MPDEQRVDGTAEEHSVKGVSRPTALRMSFDTWMRDEERVSEVIGRAAAVHRALSMIDLRC